MNKIISLIFIIMFLFSCEQKTTKTHRLDGIWEYQGTSYTLMYPASEESLSDTILAQIINKKRNRYNDIDYRYVLVIGNGELKFGNYDEDVSQYLVYKDKLLYDSMVALTELEEGKKDTTFFFSTNETVFNFKIIDADNINNVSTSTVGSGEFEGVKYIISEHFKKNENAKISYIAY